MKLKTLLTAFVFWMVSLTGPAMADVNLQFMDLVQPVKKTGQISGSVKSCSGKFEPQGLIVHIPNISISTKLGSSSQFKLLSVPAGNHTLVFEHEDRVLYSMKNVTVRPNMQTALEDVTVCPDNDGDGYNLMADMDDTNPAIYPEAREICDKVDNNGNGVVDEGCSYRKCPKGGRLCLSNWNNSNRIMRATKQPLMQPGKVEQPSSALTQKLDN
ncbi:MAG: putative metal-binding motif-containing protein [Nitrospinota bacterium]|nr:putative metal-binding motif-containing protein [Nitrospinota bacterium]